MTKTAGPSSRKSYTYLGTVDDSVFRYKWDIDIDLKYLNNMLLRKAVMGERIVLNDGYLLNLPAAREALLNPSKSPLKLLIEQNFVRILQRNESLAELPEAMASQGVESFEGLRKSAEWSDLGPMLKRWEPVLQQYQNFLPWPKKDISHGFTLMMQRLQGHTVQGLGLNHVSDDLWRRVLDTYLEQSEQSHAAARTRWENLVLELAGQEPQAKSLVDELMGLANQVYHYNFGVCLSAVRDPAQAGSSLDSSTIAVETRYSPAFADLLQVDSVMDTVTFDAPTLKLPRRVPVDARDFWEQLVRPDTELGEKRAGFVDSYEAYLNGEIDRKQLEDIADDYSRRLLRSCGEVETRSRTARLGRTAMSLGFVGAGTLLGGPVFALLLWVAENAAVPTVMKVLRRRGQEVELPVAGSKSRTPEPVSAGGAGTQLASVQLDPGKASELVSQIRDFG